MITILCRKKIERAGTSRYGSHETLSGGLDGRIHYYPSRGNNGNDMGSGKPWIRGGEKESTLAVPALSGSEGGQERRSGEDRDVEAGETGLQRTGLQRAGGISSKSST